MVSHGKKVRLFTKSLLGFVERSGSLFHIGLSNTRQQGISWFWPDWWLVTMLSISLQNHDFFFWEERTIGWADPSFYMVTCLKSNNNVAAKPCPELGAPDFSGWVIDLLEFVPLPFLPLYTQKWKLGSVIQKNRCLFSFSSVEPGSKILWI